MSKAPWPPTTALPGCDASVPPYQSVVKVVTAFDRPCIVRGLRCYRLTYSRYAPSSRLVRRAQERSRCSRDFHHGLLYFTHRNTLPCWIECQNMDSLVSLEEFRMFLEAAARRAVQA